MTPWILDAAGAALHRITDHAQLVDLSNTDEFTFRSFFMAAVRDRYPGARLETEWKRFDLLAHVDGRCALIEFKYYILRRFADLDGRPRQWKGGAGPKNEREFWQCVRKLRSFTDPAIHDRVLILAYEKRPGGERRKTFEQSYGALAPDELIARVDTLETPPLLCKVLAVH